MMSNELSEKRVCVIDHGMNVSWAERLARDTDKPVYYFTNWKSAFPTSNPLLIGHGLDNIERVQDLWEIVDDVDLFVFPDVYDGDLQLYLRLNGKRVWGSGKGEELELDRWRTKEFLKKIGLPVQPCELITGLKQLRHYLMEHDDKAIKISLTRGDGESWIHRNYDLSETKLDAMEQQLGAKKSVQEFIVEDLIEADQELGYDGYCIDGEFPMLAMFGPEIKDKCLIDAITKYDDLPKEVRLVNEKLSPALKQYQYRGFFSTEIRVGKEDGLPYLIDLTCRAPIPSGAIQQEIYTNWLDIMWNGADGKLIEPDPVDSFGSEAIIQSEFAGKNWMPVFFPKEIASSVKLFNHCKIEGVHYAIPQEGELEEIGSVVGLGKTMEDSNQACIYNAEQIEGYKIQIHTGCLEEAVEQMA